MKEFIEVTDFDDGNKVLLAVERIVTVEPDINGVFIGLSLTEKGEPLGLVVTESYDQIKRNLNINKDR